MKKRWSILLCAALLAAALTGCADYEKEDKPEETSGTGETQSVISEQTTVQNDAQEPVVVSDVDRQTAEDGTEYVTSLIESTYSDGTVTVESRSEIIYTDDSVFCESQLSTFHADGSKTVELTTTQTDTEGNVTLLEHQILEYDAAGCLIGEA